SPPTPPVRTRCKSPDRSRAAGGAAAREARGRSCARRTRLNTSSDGVDRPVVVGVPEPETELAGSPDCLTVAGNYDVLAPPLHLCFLAVHLDALDLEIHLVALCLIKDALKA